METKLELLNQLRTLSADLPPPLLRSVNMVIHKVTYPMRDILAKVPGGSLTDRAKKIGVSRQTMYVWSSEKFRPTKVQAKRIAKVTGVPIEHILDDGFEVNNGAGRKTRKKVARVAARRPSVAKNARNPAQRRRGKTAA